MICGVIANGVDCERRSFSLVYHKNYVIIFYMFRKFLRPQAGDTLVEVTIAQAILTLVLLGSSGVAVKAFHLAATAQERTKISNEAQNQMEQLRTFRDNHTWSEFLHGPDAPGLYHGVMNGSGGSCEVATPCFHMAPV